MSRNRNTNRAPGFDHRWLSGILLACSVASCTPPPAPKSADRKTTGFFSEISAAAGVNFTHTNGLAKALHPNLLQTTGSGCAMLDYDQDGHLDLYLVDGAHKSGGGNR